MSASNPIYGIAKQFHLPLETVYCYAEGCRRRIMNGGIADKSYAVWFDPATETIDYFPYKGADTHEDQRLFANAVKTRISLTIFEFLKTNGRIPS